MSQITQLLFAIQSGDQHAADELLPLVYDELRRLARVRLSSESIGQTLQPTELVHEAYLRLVGGETNTDWNGRSHFFGAAAEAMRRILVDRARKRKSQKHGGDRNRIPLGEEERWSSFAPRKNANKASGASPCDHENRLLELDTALDQFETYDAQKARYVKLRYFAGLTKSEASKAIGVSSSTGDCYWIFSRAWLQKTIEQNLE